MLHATKRASSVCLDGRADPRARAESPKDELALRYYDLSALPLLGILSRREKTMVLLVNRDGREVVVKLHHCPGASAAASPPASLSVASLRHASPRDAFARELSLLMDVQPREFGIRGCSGAVRVLGWGVAQTYKGIVMEALKGPLLTDMLNGGVATPGDAHAANPTTPAVLNTAVFSPPPVLQLLYRLNWASQLTNIVAELHQLCVFHGDLRPDNFSFRVAPSQTLFGRLAVYDFGAAARMAKHPPHLARAKTSFFDHLKEFAQEVSSPYLPTDQVHSTTDIVTYAVRHTECLVDAPAFMAPSVVPLAENCKLTSQASPTTTNSGRASRSHKSPSATRKPGSKALTSTCSSNEVLCDHRQVVRPPSSWSAGECFPGPVGAPCSHGSNANDVWQCCEGRTSNPQLYKDGPSSGGASPRPACVCPACECKEGRYEVTDLALLVVQCLKMVSNDKQLKQCPGCKRRIPLSDRRLRQWVASVGAYIDSLICRVSGGTLIMAVNDVTTPCAEVPLKIRLDEPSPRDLELLLKLRRAWSSLGVKISDQLYCLVHRALSEDVMSRPSAREFDDAILRIFNALYRFLSRLLEIPASDLDKYATELPLRLRKQPHMISQSCKTPSTLCGSD